MRFAPEQAIPLNLSPVVTELRPEMKLSLRTAIIVAILCGLLLPAILMGYVNLNQSLKSVREAQHNDQLRFLEVLVLGIREPLWNMAPDAGRPLIDSIMGDERVVRISVNDATLGSFLHANRPDRRIGQLRQLSRTIYKQGAMIGVVTLEMDDGLYTRNILRNQLFFLAALASQIAISLGLSLFLVYQRVLHPLTLLRKQAEKLTTDEVQSNNLLPGHDEIGQLSAGLEAARQALHSRIHQLEEKNVQLAADLASRQQTETALIAERDRAQRLLNVTDLIPWEANPNEWRFTFVGEQAENLLGQPLAVWYSEDFFTHCLHADDRHIIYELFTNQQHDQQSQLFRMSHRDGQTIWVDCLSSRSQDANGRVTLHGFFRDASARKKVESELEQYRNHLEESFEQRTRQLAAANHELETLSQSLAQDLRTPLRAVEGFSRVLEEDYGSQLDNNAHNYLHRIRGTIASMANQIDDLLNLAKFSSCEINPRDTDLSALASDILDEISVLNPGRSIQIDITPALHAHVDPKLMRIALYNLFDNAWKFTQAAPNARIRFGMSQINGKEVFFISDSGIGFDMSQSGRIFSPFQRLHTQAEYSGSGVGLAIVQRIISRHSGRIWAKSEVDCGATFYFTLPNA